MADDNKKDMQQDQTAPANEKATNEEKKIHVHNPFTGKEVDVTQEQLENVEKQIEAQTERD